MTKQAGPHTIEFYLYRTGKTISALVGTCEYRVAHLVGIGNVFSICARESRKTVEGHRFCIQHARIVRRELVDAREWRKANP